MNKMTDDELNRAVGADGAGLGLYTVGTGTTVCEGGNAMYMMWFDDNPKKLLATKLIEGIAAYERHFHATPNVVLVSSTEPACDVPGVRVQPTAYVRPNNYWFGWELV